jgi:hypothetical protein
VNRKALLLNVALVALIGILFWQLRSRRLAAEAHERAVLLKDGHGQVLLAPPPPTPVAPVAPAEYIDSVQKMLFAKDRNPNVIVDPPPPAPAPKHEEPKPMPPLPRYYGQIHFGGDPVVILSSPTANDQKSYAVGDKIGDFKVIAFNKDTITFDWDGKEVERSLADLKPKDAQPPQQQQAAAPPPQPAQSSVVSIGGGTSANTTVPTVGNDMGGGFHACTNPDDGSPSGTVVGGYRKVINQGLMGKSCYWEPIK